MVLAEAAMDALFLSYADPDLASEIILSISSLRHVRIFPVCVRMAAIIWWPTMGKSAVPRPNGASRYGVVDQLFGRTGNMPWLRRLYPGAAAYMRWWLDHRSDAEGWLVYACSWESGQDVSSRFGPQQTGGTIIQHVRPVDLQASMVQSAVILASWAEILSSAYTDEALPQSRYC